MDPAEADRIRSLSLSRRRVAALLLLPAAVLLVLAFTAPSVQPDPHGWEAAKCLAAILGLGLFIGGSALLAKAKGLHPAWGLLGLGCFLGFVALYYMPNRCPTCFGRYRSDLAECPACGTPS